MADFYVWVMRWVKQLDGRWLLKLSCGHDMILDQPEMHIRTRECSRCRGHAT